MIGLSDFPYEDIIDRKYVRRINKKPMSMKNRAAQFSPFAAVVGHDASVEEAARLTDRKIELCEDELYELNEKLKCVRERAVVTVIYFHKDAKKDGGEYVKKKAAVKRIDEIYKTITFCDNTKINMDDILDIIVCCN